MAIRLRMRRARAAPAISKVSTRFTPWCTPEAHSTLDSQAISPVLRQTVAYSCMALLVSMRSTKGWPARSGNTSWRTWMRWAMGTVSPLSRACHRPFACW